jgi:hypothetical protein
MLGSTERAAWQWEVNGHASYKVGEAVTTHEAGVWGLLRVYARLSAENAIETLTGLALDASHGPSGWAVRPIVASTM